MKKLHFLFLFMVCAIFAHSQVSPTRLYLHSLIVDEADIKYNEPGNSEVEGYFIMDEDSSGLMTWGRGLDTLKINNDTLVLVFGRSLDSLYVTIPGLSSGISIADNGLTESGDSVKLGGTLNQATTINTGSNYLTIDRGNNYLFESGNNFLGFGSTGHLMRYELAATRTLMNGVVSAPGTTRPTVYAGWLDLVNSKYYGLNVDTADNCTFGYDNTAGTILKQVVATSVGIALTNTTLTGNSSVSVSGAGNIDLVASDTLNIGIEGNDFKFTVLADTSNFNLYVGNGAGDNASQIIVDADSMKFDNDDGIYIFKNVPNYTNDAAADADSGLPSGALYTIDADTRAIRRKP